MTSSMARRHQTTAALAPLQVNMSICIYMFIYVCMTCVCMYVYMCLTICIYPCVLLVFTYSHLWHAATRR